MALIASVARVEASAGRMCAAFARGVTIAGAGGGRDDAARVVPPRAPRHRRPARRRALALGGRPRLVPSSRAVSINGRGRAGLGALRASAAGNRSNASEELTASDEDGVVVEGVVLDDARDGHSQHIGHDNLDDVAHASHAEHSPVDEEEEKAFRQQVATAFDAVARDANFQEDLRRRSAESSESPGGEFGGHADLGESVAQPTSDPGRAVAARDQAPDVLRRARALFVAGALCHHWYGCVNVPQWGALAGGACLVIAWLNLSNDAWDAATGVDDSKPESVVRLLGGDESEDARKAAVNKVRHRVGVSRARRGRVVLRRDAAGDRDAAADVAYTVLAMLGAAVAAGHAYRGPPFRLSYKGMGEPLCFAAFGPLATGAFYLALAGGVPGGSVWMGVPATPDAASARGARRGGVGGSHDHVHPVHLALPPEEGDRAAGKESPSSGWGCVRRSTSCAAACSSTTSSRRSSRSTDGCPSWARWASSSPCRCPSA